MQINIDNFIEYINGYYLKNKIDIDTEINAKYGRSKITRVIYNTYLDSIKYYYGDINIDETVKYDKTVYLGSVLSLNDNILNIILNNIKRIEFEKLYPNIIVKLLDSGELKINIKELHYIYKFIVENYDNILINDNFNKDAKLFLRSLINGMFSILMSPFNINVDNKQLITDYPRNIFYSLKDKENVYYIDTDTIYVKEFNDDIKKIIDKLELPYHIEDVLCSYFIQKKRYITEDNGKIKKVGLSKKQLKNYIDIINKFNHKLRIKKIKKFYKNV